MPIYYTVYRTTNQVNGKFYIGMHQTRNLADGYLGSGKIFKQALKKYRGKSFQKEILCFCKSEAEMRAKEAELVEMHKPPYNLMQGGIAGFTHDVRTKKRISKTMTGRKRKPFSEETKARMRISQQARRAAEAS